METAEVIRMERTYDAPAAAVFDAWTNEAVLRRWFHAERDWETARQRRPAGRRRGPGRHARPLQGGGPRRRRSLHRGRPSQPPRLHLDLGRRGSRDADRDRLRESTAARPRSASPTATWSTSSGCVTTKKAGTAASTTSNGRWPARTREPPVIPRPHRRDPGRGDRAQLRAGDLAGGGIAALKVRGASPGSRGGLPGGRAAERLDSPRVRVRVARDRRRIRILHQRAEAAITDLIATRGPDKTICPSEAARALAGDGDFRPFMELVREAAGALAADGRVEVTEKGEPVTIAEAHGPVRIGLPEHS